MKINPPYLRMLLFSLLLPATSGWGQAVQTIKDINTSGLAPSETSNEQMLSIGNRLYIGTDDDIVGSELWSLNLYARFNSPKAIIRDSVGNLFVVDTGNHIIRRLSGATTAAASVSTEAGSAELSGNVNKVGLAASFNTPSSIARDAAGNLYVADTANHVIRRITPEGVVTTYAGTGVAGSQNSGDASAAQFRSPTGVAVDSANIVYVADTGNHVIRRIAATGTKAVTTFSGVAGVSSAGFTDGSPSVAKFSSPQGIVIDTLANIYVADTGNHAIRRVDGTGAVVTVAGSPTSSGATDGRGSVGIGTTIAQFLSPEGVTLGSAGNLFVADTGNHSIRKIVVTPTSGALTNVVVSTLAGGAAGSGYQDGTGSAARFNSPSGLTADTSNNVSVVDAGNHVIRRITATGVTTTIGGQPNNPGSEDGAATGGLFGNVPSVVKDILAGGDSSSPDQLTNVAGTLYFTAKDLTDRRDIWRSDGTSGGTVVVKNDNLSFFPTEGPKQLTNVNGMLYFEGNSGIYGKELWRTNGTSSGTFMVKDTNPGGEDGAVGSLLAVNNSLVYTATQGVVRNGNDITRNVGPEMWSIATSATNPTQLYAPPADFSGVNWDIQNLRFLRNFVYFVANGIDPSNNDSATGNELFRLNPASGGNFSLVKDVNEGAPGSDPDQLTISGPPATGRLYFVASTPSDGRELWMSEGLVQANAEQVENINAIGGTGSGIQNLTPILISNGATVTNSVVFTANNGIDGVELWVSGGTSSSTNLLKNITTTDPANTSDSVLANFVNLSPSLVVFTQLLDGKLLLWRTDGTSNGTFLIEDFVTEPSQDDEPDTPVDFRRPTVVGNTLYFMIGDDQLWKTTGTNDETTVRIHRFRQGTAGSNAADFTLLADGRVVFSVFTTAEGREPWITDGTPANTLLLSDVIVGSAEQSLPRNFTPATTNRFFFTEGKKISSDPDQYESEIYVVNNDAVSLLKKINPTGDSVVSDLIWNPNNATLFFAADNGTNSNPPDIELWKSDGTTIGTTLVKEINTSTGGASAPGNFVALGNNVYFSAAADGIGREIFKSDGTPGNTEFVKDISVGFNDSNPEELVVMGGKIYFVATGSGGDSGALNTGRELWVTDGIPEGSVGAPVHTKVVKDVVKGSSSSIAEGDKAYLTVVGNDLYFVADDGAKGKELWKTNGTSTGTIMVKDIKTTAFEGSNPTELRSVNGKLFFLADDGVNGRELWTSNGTAAGTVMVSTGTRTGLVTGSGDANIQNLTVVNDVVTFVANDGVSGREVWLSDGTTSGTFIAADFIPGASSSNPSSLFALNGNLIFSASDAETGAEPRSALTAPKISIEQPVAVALPSDGSAVVDFTPVTPVPFGTGPSSSASLSLTIKNSGINNLRNVTASLSGLHAADFSISTKPAAIIAKNGSSPLVVKFTPKEGGERVAKLTVISSDPLIPSFVIDLSGDCTKETTVISQPNSQFVKVGAPVTLSAAGTTTAPTPLTLQWRKNGAAITGAVTNPLYLWSAKLTDAGAYTAQFKSNSTTAGTGTSDAAQLSVVEDFSPARVQTIPAGTPTGKTTIAVKASSSGIAYPLSYQWKRSANSNLSSPETLANTTTLAVTKFTNVTTATLTITGAAAVDNGYYFCEVRVLGNPTPLVGGTTELRVFTLPPVVTPAQTLPVGIVGANYFYQISVDADPLKTPTTFTAKPLPLGLTLDAKTGIISGVPTKPGTTSVKLGATNGRTPVPAEVTAVLTVVDLPSGLDGVFQGLVARNPEINGMTGGRVEVTVSKTGSYSGKLVLGAITSSFKGNLSFGHNGTPAAIPPFTSTVRIPRTTIAAPLDLTFTIDSATKNIFSSAEITSVSSSGPVSATVTGWKANTNPARYVGLYNFGIRLATPGPNNDIPQGNGYGAFTVAAKGTLSIAGKTADGETITSATHVGPSGQVLLYQSLYTTTRKGSILGQLDLGLGAAVDLNDTTDNTLDSTNLDWVRPPNPAVVSATAATRTYRAGFGLPDTSVVSPLALEAFGGRYVPPTALLKITTPPAATPVPTAANADVKFVEGGLDTNVPSGVGASLDPDIAVAVTATNTNVIIGTNGAKTSITANRTSGAITGKFTLSDPNARTVIPLTPNPISRVVTYQGLIVPDNVTLTHEGVGYFMLPQLPTANNATLVTTTPILSGKVTYKKRP